MNYGRGWDGTKPAFQEEGVMPRSGQTIVNPRTGQTMVFRETAEQTAGELLRIECHHEPGTSREPVHTHPGQESRFEILSGCLTFQLDGVERTAEPGDVVTVPANLPHCFWNSGPGPARYLQEFRPALDSERFFRTLFELSAAGKINDKGMPSPLALPILVSAMGDAIRPMNPPWPVVRATASFLRPVAMLRGYHRFAVRDVPTPPASLARSLDKEEIRERLAATRAGFLEALGSVSESDLRRPSDNPAWTVGAIFAHLTSSLELLPREVEKARQGKGMYNFPKVVLDPLNALLTRREARNQTVEALRIRYEAAFEAAIATLDELSATELVAGARFWGEGFYDIAALYAAQTDHLAEHQRDIRDVRVSPGRPAENGR